jgi:hypothetical protein
MGMKTTTAERMNRVAAGMAADLGITVEQARLIMKVALRTQGAEIVAALREVAS